MDRPVILVARSRASDDYLESVRRAGGAPRLVDATTGTPASFDGIGGLLLTGGPDVDPRLYGEEPDPSFEAAPHGRDGFEIEILARAIERDLPVFAICRGMQVLNVASGGTLVQHIPNDIPRALEHSIKTPPWAIAHDVSVSTDSMLARAMNLENEAEQTIQVPVNSRHHQSLKHVAADLRVVGTASDGVIEAVERPASRFCVAVQWHPENFWRTGEFDALFAAFVAASREGR